MTKNHVDENSTESRLVRNRRNMLQAAAGLVVASTLPMAVLGATRDSRLLNKVSVPSEVTMALADGKRLKLTRSGTKVWYGQLVDKYGRLVSKTASGSFRLKSGEQLKLNRYGKVYFGAVSDKGGLDGGFVECIDPPDCGG